ncbi:MAG: flagellar motor switch protein FliG [Solirubrobacteraceae bacterium]|nr:flagellar motor switch protein FliG [Solirubrobacteraceae bacterium]
MSQPANTIAFPAGTGGAVGGLAPVPGAGTAAAPAIQGGASKAAIALIALGAEAAAEVLKHLPEAQAEKLSAEMAMLGPIDDAMLDSVCDELATLTGDANQPQGGIGFTRDVLERVVGAERAEDLIRQFLGGDPKPFEFMRSMAAEEVALLLAGESPQTIALVAAGVRPAMAGKILDGLGTELQADVARRVAMMPPPDPRILQDIDRGLREKANQLGDSGADGEAAAAASGVDQLAAILQGAGRATERQVLEGLEAVDPELAEAVRAKMFTFEDMVKLTDKDLQLVLRDIDGKDLVLALRGVPEELMARVVENMSQRAAETLKEDLEMQPPQKRAVVEEAQTKVVAAIRALDEAGQITLPMAEEPGEEGGEVEILL